MYASQNGHVEVVDTFLQHGASVELPNNVSALTHRPVYVYMYILKIPLQRQK